MCLDDRVQAHRGAWLILNVTPGFLLSDGAEAKAQARTPSCFPTHSPKHFVD